MASIIKVDTIQTAAGGTPGLADLGITATGSILQFAKAEFTGTDVTSSTSYVSTPVTIDFTPKSASSTLIVEVSLGYWGTYSDLTTSNNGLDAKIYRDGSAASDQNGLVMNQSGVSNIPIMAVPVYMRYITTSNSTSQTTFTLYRKTNNGNPSYIFYDQYITVTEIAG